MFDIKDLNSGGKGSLELSLIHGKKINIENRKLGARSYAIMHQHY
jgi:hypothetical protein